MSLKVIDFLQDLNDIGVGHTSFWEKPIHLLVEVVIPRFCIEEIEKGEYVMEEYDINDPEILRVVLNITKDKKFTTNVIWEISKDFQNYSKGDLRDFIQYDFETNNFEIKGLVTYEKIEQLLDKEIILNLPMKQDNYEFTMRYKLGNLLCVNNHENRFEVVYNSYTEDEVVDIVRVDY